MMLKTSGCFCLITLIMLFSLVSQGNCAWDLWSMGYTRYDNLVLAGTDDYGYAVATDVNGNVYVAGRSEVADASPDNEHVVLKYDSSGNEQWAYHHGASLLQPSTVKDVVVDDDGNVYVAALGNYTGDPLNAYNCVVRILKLDLQGNLLWEYLYGEENFRNEPWDLDLDAIGNVYVTGGMADYGPYMTIKLDPEGNLQWETIYDDELSVYAMKVDGEGNVHLGGAGSIGIVALKYDTDGNLLWEAEYDGHEGQDQANAIDIDGSGNVFLTGKSRYNSYYYDSEYVTLKYDSEGTFLWSAVLGVYPDRGWNEAQDIMVDSQGNAIVTGVSRQHIEGQEGQYHYADYVTVKYDSTGTELWRAVYHADPLDYGYRGSSLAIVLDGDDNVILSGSRCYDMEVNPWNPELKTFYTDPVLVKYDAAGNELWESPRVLGSDPIVDSSGHIVIGGTNYSELGDKDIGAARYSPAGDLLWESSYNGGTSLVSGRDEIYDMAEGAEGNIIVIGTGGTLALDEAGEILWSHPETGRRLEIDADGNIYFGNSAAELFKLDPDGQVLWSRPDTGSIIKLSPEGYVYAATAVPSDGADESTLQTTKLDLDGNMLWTDVYEGPVLGENTPSSIAVDTEGNAFVVGTSAGDGTDLDIVTIKYGPLGSREWVVRYDGPAMGEDYPNAAEVDHGGNVLVTGTSLGVGTRMDAVTIKYDTGGNQLWASRYNRTGTNLDDSSHFVAVDDDDCVYVAGSSISGYILTQNLPYYKEILTVKYDPDGNELWSAVFAGPLPALSMVRVRDMTMDDEANVYLIGTDMWDPTGLIGDPTPRATILKYSSTGERIYLKEFNSLPTAPEASYNGRAILLHSNGKIIAGLRANAWGTETDYMIVRMEEHWTDRIDWIPASTVAHDGSLISDGRSVSIGYVSSLLIPLLAVLGLKAAGRKRRFRGSAAK